MSDIKVSQRLFVAHLRAAPCAAVDLSHSFYAQKVKFPLKLHFDQTFCVDPLCPALVHLSCAFSPKFVKMQGTPTFSCDTN